jgi:hypothetical protein
VGVLLAEAALMVAPLLINNLLPPTGERNAAAAAAHAAQVMHVERLLGVDVEPALTGFLGSHPALFGGALTYYAVMHFAVAAAAAVILAIARPQLWAPMRTTFVVGSLAALVVSRLWPLAPPNLVRGFEIVAAASHPPNPYAAMPSLHTAWALWSALALIVAAWPDGRRLRALAVAAGGTHLGLIVLIVLSTGHHFVLDVIGGVSVIAVGAGVAMAVRAYQRGTEQGRWSMRWLRRRQACSASATG